MNNEELAQSLSGNQRYSLIDVTKTIMVCGTLLISPVSTNGVAASRHNLTTIKNGSGSYAVSRLYRQSEPTWSAVKFVPTIKAESTGCVSTTALKLINQLSFINHDAEAERQADVFFATKPVKTKKVVIRKRNVS